MVTNIARDSAPRGRVGSLRPLPITLAIVSALATGACDNHGGSDAAAPATAPTARETTPRQTHRAATPASADTEAGVAPQAAAGISGADAAFMVEDSRTRVVLMLAERIAAGRRLPDPPRP